MSQPTPKIGDVNVRGFVLPATCAGDVCALPSLYGFYPADFFNPLMFYVPGGTGLPEGTEVYFDIVANPNYNPNTPTDPTAYAANVRRA